jgi:hypothetical protein
MASSKLVTLLIYHAMITPMRAEFVRLNAARLGMRQEDLDEALVLINQIAEYKRLNGELHVRSGRGLATVFYLSQDKIEISGGHDMEDYSGHWAVLYLPGDAATWFNRNQSISTRLTETVALQSSLDDISFSSSPVTKLLTA